MKIQITIYAAEGSYGGTWLTVTEEKWEQLEEEMIDAANGDGCLRLPQPNGYLFISRDIMKNAVIEVVIDK